MFCPNCGNQIPDGSFFCPSCGTAAAPAQPAAQAPASVSQPEAYRQAAPGQTFVNQPGAYQQTAPGQTFVNQPVAYQQTAPGQTFVNQPGVYQQAAPGQTFANQPGVYQQTASAGANVYTPAGYRQPAATDKYQGMKMGWHGFLCYFALWAGLLSNLANAFTLFTGSHYQGQAAQVYSVFPALHALDVTYAVVLLALAVLSGVTAVWLIKLRKKGPMLLTVCYAVNCASVVLYLIMGAAILNVPVAQMFDTSTFISLVFSIVMLFVNRAYYKKREALFVN